MAGILDFYNYDSGINDMVSQKQQLLDNQAKIDGIQDKKIKELEEGGGTTIPDSQGHWLFKDADITYNSDRVDNVWMTVTSGVEKVDGGIKIPQGDYINISTDYSREYFNNYTVLMDIKLGDVNGYAALFDNRQGKDASLFINNGKIGKNTTPNVGPGYVGDIKADTWYQVVFVVANDYLRLYLNGEKIGESSGKSEYEWRFINNFYLFYDDDGEEKEITTSQIRFWDIPLNDSEIEKLSKYGDKKVVYHRDLDKLLVILNEIASTFGFIITKTWNDNTKEYDFVKTPISTQSGDESGPDSPSQEESSPSNGDESDSSPSTPIEE